MVELIYPTVDVFIYDLRHGFLDNREQIESNRRKFLQKVYQDNILEQKLTQLEHLERDNVDDIELIVEPFEGNLDGYYYGLQLDDSYSLQINYSGDKRSTEKLELPTEIEKIADYKKVIVEHINKTKVLSSFESEISKDKKGNIGETWLIRGQISSDRDSALEIAKSCYQQLAPQVISHQAPTISQKHDSNQFLDGYLFEFWQPSLEQDYHLLVWLFPKHLELKSIEQQANSTYGDLKRLLLYRHKITLAYHESQTLKRQLKQRYESVYRQLNLLEERLKSRRYSLDILKFGLADNLKNSCEYTSLLSKLTILKSSIEVNLNNYEKRLRIIQENDTPSQIDNLKSFADRTREQYQQDIEATFSYFSSGKTLLDQTIKTIEGIVNLEQTQSDRNLNELVAVVSAGLGAGAITASLISAQPPTGKTSIEFYGTNIKITLLVVVVGGVVGYLLWRLYLWLGSFRRKRKS